MTTLNIGADPRWVARIRGSKSDLATTRQHYSDRLLSVTEENEDSCALLSSPRFEDCQDRHELRAVATELVHDINVALGVANGHFKGIELLGAIEHLERGRQNHILFAETAQFVIMTGVGAVGLAGDQRSFAERTTVLMQRDARVRELAEKLGVRPSGWGDLNLVYETIKGLMSPTGERKDWEHLVTLGWVTKADSNRFHATAGHYRHGHPRDPIPADIKPMGLGEADKWIRELFRRTVDHLEP